MKVKDKTPDKNIVTNHGQLQVFEKCWTSFIQIFHHLLLSHRKVLQGFVLVGSPTQKLVSLFSQALILDLVPPSQSLLHGPQSDQGDHATS